MGMDGGEWFRFLRSMYICCWATFYPASTLKYFPAPFSDSVRAPES